MLTLLALTHLTGRRMIPTLDHRKVYWWGEKSNISIIDLDSLEVQDYPMSSNNPSSKLITYDILVINQKIVYIMEEAGVYGMIYIYDLLTQNVIGNWTYSNDDCNTLIPSFFNYLPFSQLNSRGAWHYCQINQRQ
jgi:hypothetical protein